MVSVNLMSASVVLARKRARRIRAWLAMVLTIAAISAVPVAVDLVKTARAAALESQIGPLGEEVAATRTKVEALETQCRDLQARIAQADALRAKRSWAGLIAAIGRHAPEQVWLVKMESGVRAAIPTGEIRRAEPVPAAPREKAAPQPVRLDGPTHLTVTGYALDHPWLYEFMTRLKESGLFGSVELISAAREPFLQGLAVHFVLECRWGGGDET